MNFIWDKITEWLKELLVSGVVGNLSGLFDSINSQVADVAGTVGASPQAWNGVFDVTQHVVNQAAGVIFGDTAMNVSELMGDIEARLMDMEIGPLFGLWFQSSLIGIIAWALSICIFIITYGRMIEIYMITSVAPIPMATMVNREWGQMGQNYLRSLFALGFQAFLIMVCVGIYAVLVQNISVDSDVSTALWTCIGYTVLLCFTLFKSSSVAKSIFNAH